MSHSQFHCTGRVYLDLHGLIFETSICYWQDQPGSPQDGRPARRPGAVHRVGRCRETGRLEGGGRSLCCCIGLWGPSDALGV